MNVYTGKAISDGIAIGTLLFYKKDEQEVKRYKVENTEYELERYERAKYRAIEELKLLYQKALLEVGEVNAEIFEVHALMLEDDDFNDSVKNMIESQMVNAEYAIACTGDNFAAMFTQMENEYFQARAVDIRDISERLITVLSERKQEEQFPQKPAVVAAEDLVPSETVQMDKANLLGFVANSCSANSHTAILARTMGIPAVSGITLKEEWNGATVVIDGCEGVFIVNPDEQTLNDMRMKKREKDEQKTLLFHFKEKKHLPKAERKSICMQMPEIFQMLEMF